MFIIIEFIDNDIKYNSIKYYNRKKYILIIIKIKTAIIITIIIILFSTTMIKTIKIMKRITMMIIVLIIMK